jgi:hypothetical protein
MGPPSPFGQLIHTANCSLRTLLPCEPAAHNYRKNGPGYGHVFANRTAAISTSVERFAIEITQQAAQGMVRVGDAMIATGFERLAESLSQMGRV